jgi:hypothetical protein
MPRNSGGLPPYRDHQPVTIDNFGGLWDQNDPQTCPLDHFTECSNIDYQGNSVISRPGIDISQDVALPLSNVKRLYNYPTLTGNTIIALTYDELTGAGSIYHVANSTTTYGPLLTIVGMRDFAFVPFAGRAYISPIGYYTLEAIGEGTLNIEKGLQNEVVYVYLGAGVAARAAAGTPLSGALTIANGAAGHTDPGFHLFGFVAETDTGALLAPGALTGFTTATLSSVSFGTVPTSGSPTITKRHLVATKVILGYNGNTEGYQYFFVPNATINNNTDTFLNNISFYDAELLEDASYLFDNYETIPAGATMCLYHQRLVVGATYDDPSLLAISAVGEPESISQVNGLIVVTEDGNPLTNVQELRDILYVFKRSWSTSYADNGDDPATWGEVLVDTGLGCPIHGIGTVLNSGGTSVDYLLIATYQGMFLFNGRYVTPELSWKIFGYWGRYDRNAFRTIQIVNSPIRKKIFMSDPNGNVLVADYLKGLDPKTARWTVWEWDVHMNSVCIAGIDEILFGADLT